MTRQIAGRRPQTLVLDLLGAYVHGRRRSVWSGGLVALLGDLGFSAAASRIALQRVAGRGLLARERSGRLVHLALTVRGERLLSDGDARIFTFGRAPAVANDPWTVVWHQVPANHRLQRQRLAARLRFWGFGQVRDGLWLVPHDRAAHVMGAVQELGLGPRVTTVVGSPACAIDPASAWDLPGLRDAYRRFAERTLAAGDPGELTDEAAFLERTRLVHEFRRFPLLDPELPGQRGLERQRREAADLFADRYERLAVGASRHVDRRSTSPQYALALTRAGSGPLVDSGREAEWRS
ncbi:MAG: PaaX family transcriptional regulator C-terminal domain-containing protein [Candidatus Dormiibacterota bacterium]